MFAQGSSARQADGLKTMPVDAAIVGLVDTVHVQGQRTYTANNS
jgi:ethanolamine utilization protein EutN